MEPKFVSLIELAERLRRACSDHQVLLIQH